MAGDVGFDPAGFLNMKRFKYTKGADGKMFVGWTEDIDWAENVVPEAAMMWNDVETRTPVTTLMWMREAEIKHGRICMLAVLGWIAVDLGAVGPGLPASLKGLSSFQAHDAAVAQGSLIVLMMFCGVFEIAGSGGLAASLKGERVPGDFALTGGFGKTEPELRKLRENEIAHCRLAM